MLQMIVLKHMTVTTESTWLENKEMITNEVSSVHGQVQYDIIIYPSQIALVIGMIANHFCTEKLLILGFLRRTIQSNPNIKPVNPKIARNGVRSIKRLQF